ncbi:MAG: hypothetical protein HQL58_12960 [Magnetococcales bacterium]|nr:hypothetical protein [Magnetococcales bacterium]
MKIMMIPTTDPDRMTAEERLTEVAAILSAGIKRLLEKRKRENIPVDKPLVRRSNVHQNNP